MQLPLPLSLLPHLCRRFGAINETASWSVTGDANDSAVTKTATGIELFYSRGTYYCAGCGDNYFSFTTTVDNTGTGGVDFSYNAFNGWFMSGSDLTFLVNGNAIAAFGGYDIHDSVSFNFTAGDVLELRAHETNYDSQPYIEGRIAMSNFKRRARSEQRTRAGQPCPDGPGPAGCRRRPPQAQVRESKGKGAQTSAPGIKKSSRGCFFCVLGIAKDQK